MNTYLYIQHKKYFKTETAKEAARKAAKYYFKTKPTKQTVSISIQNTKTMKVYRYIASKTMKSITISRKLKATAGTLFTDGSEVTLYDTKNKGYITAYDPGEIDDPFYYYSNGRIKGKKYRLSDIVTSNSIFILNKLFRTHHFRLKNATDKYAYFYAISDKFCLASSKETGHELDDDDIIITTYSNKLPKIRVMPHLKFVTYLRSRETGSQSSKFSKFSRS